MMTTDTDTPRRLAQQFLIGRVEEVDATKARAHIRIDDEWVIPDLPWLTGRAGDDKMWIGLDPGEQVLIACPGGNPAQGVIIGALFSDQNPAPAGSTDLAVTEWADDSRMSYDRADHCLRFTLTDKAAFVFDEERARLTHGDNVSIEATSDQIQAAVGGASITFEKNRIRIAVGSASITLDTSGVSIAGAAINLN